MRRPPDLASLRAAVWAARALRYVRRELRDRPLREVRVPAPPALPEHAARGVFAALRRVEPSCLERSLVLQRWMASHGDPREVVVGVSAPGAFRAHAWLAGEHPPEGAGFAELMRLAP
jgi:transglutaminase superfamily protein